MTKFKFIGSTKENHNKLISLGMRFGVQHIRKMTIGEKITELANNGNEEAKKICMENKEFFTELN